MIQSAKEDVLWNSFFPLFLDKMARNIRRDISREMEKHGITSAHAPYLIALHIHDGQTMMSLSHFLDMDRSNSCRILADLEEKGLVYDRRKYRTSKNYQIFLTDKGKMVADDLMDSIDHLVKHYFEGIDESEYIKARNTLIRIFNNLNYSDSKSNGAEQVPYYSHFSENQNQQAASSEDLMAGKDGLVKTRRQSNNINL